LGRPACIGTRMLRRVCFFGMIRHPALHTWCAGVCPAAGKFCKALATSAIEKGLE